MSLLLHHRIFDSDFDSSALPNLACPCVCTGADWPLFELAYVPGLALDYAPATEQEMLGRDDSACLYVRLLVG
jgi:hypothetical protein|eukprot:CAMPEP_0174342822 /NCGR_PEP_ID=MMETSP0810-20121108/26449_1 /TAXON_ID=73025 ORGANISM="Eutreptiella gymnastica-like, Strain CCMP1594" /NCGR_SAMPLE_ID=MMETSP0810 /ASSEMBLY_ACC=CAM_ASM_000659 /LENGTH=72 /DNA_ID=CAMNT_0015465149 /DNA_START=262 /DNA_END=480 /DNA_ORIENTATION=+